MLTVAQPRLRRSRLGLVAGATAIVLAVVGCTGDSDNSSDSGDDDRSDLPVITVGLALDVGGRGDMSSNDQVIAGVERLSDEYDVQIVDASADANETTEDKAGRLRRLVDDEANPVIAVGAAYADALTVVAPEFPDIRFAIVDGVVTVANVASLTFAEEQGSFLVGAAAALTSESASIGFVGGCRVPLQQKYEAGFRAGVTAADPAALVQVAYISEPPGCSGFNDETAGEELAGTQFDAGADVTYAVAGGSSTGVFEAARTADGWGIGADTDRYTTAPDGLKPVILTSMLKRLDNAAYAFVLAITEGAPFTGTQVFDLAREGVGYSTSGGFVDDITDQLDAFGEQIVSGQIVVPTVPPTG